MVKMERKAKTVIAKAKAMTNLIQVRAKMKMVIAKVMTNQITAKAQVQIPAQVLCRRRLWMCQQMRRKR
jgi:hypothetical protein